MSKIGKKLITIPTGVTVTVNGAHVTVKGPKGELQKDLPAGLTIIVENNVATVQPNTGTTSVTWGLGRALLSNMITGAAQGFTKVLELSGVGYKAQMKGTDLELNLG